MRVGVLGGGGAMGGLYGAYLAEAGNDVVLIDVAEPAVAAINANGLLLEEKDGASRRVNVRASADPGSLGSVDLLINFVKCYHTEAAIRSAGPMIGPDTAVLTLQNGWGNADRISAIVGAERVLVGLTYHSGTLVAPGHVKHPSAGPTFVGELGGGLTPRLRRVEDMFRAAGLEVAASERILDEVWKKLALNVCALPTSALTRLRAHELVAGGDMTRLMQALLREVVAVAQAQGIALDFDERWGNIATMLGRAVGGKPSMLQDVEARRRTEIDVINGAIVAAGQRTGVATPYNEALVWLVRSLEETFAPDRQAAA